MPATPLVRAACRRVWLVTFAQIKKDIGISIICCQHLNHWGRLSLKMLNGWNVFGRLGWLSSVNHFRLDLARQIAIAPPICFGLLTLLPASKSAFSPNTGGFFCQKRLEPWMDYALSHLGRQSASKVGEMPAFATLVKTPGQEEQSPARLIALSPS